MKTLHADLLSAQTVGYPTGGYKPAIKCIVTAKSGSPTYDYSFDPTKNTNRLENVQLNWSREEESGVLLVKNNDRTILTDLTGHYVDIGMGLDTASGVRWGTSDGASRPRLWVVEQQNVSGGGKDSKKDIYTVFKLQGVWSGVLNQQPLRLGTAPYYQDENGLLAGKTIYGCLKYLIETTLSTQTGISFTLDALGDVNDGYIGTTIPFLVVNSGSFVVGTVYRILTVGSTDYMAEHGASANTIGVVFIAAVVGTGNGTAVGPPLVQLNGTPDSGQQGIGQPDTPKTFETYKSLIHDLMNLTNCVLRAEPGLAFKVVYPQDTDATDETYASSAALGHPFYEYLNVSISMRPNHVEVFGKQDASVSGNWYDPDHYDGATPATTPQNYDGTFMPVVKSDWYPGLQTPGECGAQAAAIGRQLREQRLSQRLIIPMDTRVELYDRIAVIDTRGVA